MNKWRILFVDDESNVLDGLRRMLRVKRDVWDMRFADSAAGALEMMREEEADVLVSDMRMPGMNGAELLTRARDEHPRTTRIMLSGQSDLDLIVKSVLPAHQFLTKPCKAETLVRVIEDALRAKETITDSGLQSVVSAIDKLPVLPRAYQEIMEELNTPEPSMTKITRIVSRDVGMAAEILKVVNSSFFGFARRVDSLERAVTLLGINTIRSLVLGVHIFSAFDATGLAGYDLKKLWEHSIRTSSLAKLLCQAEGRDKEAQNEAGIAALLHDVGKLVFAANLQEEYARVLAKVRAENRLVRVVELEILGTTHAEVGAYLMSLWGMPARVVEGILSHHQPRAGDGGFDLPAAVHVANVLDHEHWNINPEYAKPEMDKTYLESLGCLERIEAWSQAAGEFMNEVRNAGT